LVVLAEPYGAGSTIATAMSEATPRNTHRRRRNGGTFVRMGGQGQAAFKPVTKSVGRNQGYHYCERCGQKRKACRCS
jgi:hypothetical protein